MPSSQLDLQLLHGGLGAATPAWTLDVDDDKELELYTKIFQQFYAPFGHLKNETTVIDWVSVLSGLDNGRKNAFISSAITQFRQAYSNNSGFQVLRDEMEVKIKVPLSAKNAVDHAGCLLTATMGDIEVDDEVLPSGKLAVLTLLAQKTIRETLADGLPQISVEPVSYPAPEPMERIWQKLTKTIMTMKKKTDPNDPDVVSIMSYVRVGISGMIRLTDDILNRSVCVETLCTLLGMYKGATGPCTKDDGMKVLRSELEREIRKTVLACRGRNYRRSSPTTESHPEEDVLLTNGFDVLNGMLWQAFPVLNAPQNVRDAAKAAAAEDVANARAAFLMDNIDVLSAQAKLFAQTVQRAEVTKEQVKSMQQSIALVSMSMHKTLGIWKSTEWVASLWLSQVHVGLPNSVTGKQEDFNLFEFLRSAHSERAMRGSSWKLPQIFGRRLPVFKRCKFFVLTEVADPTLNGRIQVIIPRGASTISEFVLPRTKKTISLREMRGCVHGCLRVMTDLLPLVLAMLDTTLEMFERPVTTIAEWNARIRRRDDEASSRGGGNDGEWGMGNGEHEQNGYPPQRGYPTTAPYSTYMSASPSPTYYGTSDNGGPSYDAACCDSCGSCGDCCEACCGALSSC